MPWEGALLPGAGFLSGLACLCCRKGPAPRGRSWELILQSETGGWAWGSAYNSDSLEVLKINKALGVWGGLGGWGGPAGL